MKDKLIKLSMAGIAVAMLVLAPAVGASADLSTNYVSAGILRSEAYYNTNLKRASTTDKASDGWGSMVRWSLNNGGSGSKQNINGAGSTDYAYPDLSNATQIKIVSCSVDNGLEKGCGVYTGYQNV